MTALITELFTPLNDETLFEDVLAPSFLTSPANEKPSILPQAEVDGSTGDDDPLDGTEDDDVINGLEGNDVINGLGGDDIIDGGLGDDTIDGGDGEDTVSYQSFASGDGTTGVTINTGISNPTAPRTFDTDGMGTDTIINIENILGSDFNDDLAGIFDRIDGGAGDDVLRLLLSAGLPDFEGGDGTDTLDFSDITNSFDLFVDLNGGYIFNAFTGTTFSGTISGIESYVGGQGRDNVVGTAGVDVIRTGDGDDQIQSGRGRDRVEAGNGNDRFILTETPNNGIFVNGEGGTDTLVISRDGVVSLAQRALTFRRFEAISFEDVEGASGPIETTFRINQAHIDNPFEFVSDTVVTGNLGDIDNFVISYFQTPNNLLDLSNWSFVDWEEQDTFAFDGATLSGGRQIVGPNVDTTYDFGAGDDTVTGGIGDDVFNSRGGADVLNGGDGSDRLNSGDGDDTLNGDAGDDVLIGGLGADAMDGGEGFDVASYENADAGIFASLFVGEGLTGEAAGDSFVNIEGLTGSAFNDILVGRDGASDTLRGGDGSDGLRGNGGDDFLYGEGGNDLLFSGFGADHHDGGDGTDTVLYSLAGSGVIVNLDAGVGALGHAEGDSFVNIENVIGSAFADLLVGDAGANLLEGRAGNDTLSGRDGDDILIGGNGADTLRGGDGFDTASYADQASGVVASLFTGVASGGDVLEDIESLIGSSFNDVLVGRDGAADTLIGGAGNDALRGNGGDDIMRGGEGNDLFFSGFGADSHDGGAGIDTVAYNQANAGLIVRLDLGQGFFNQAQGDTYTGIENIVGTAFRDALTGDEVANRLEGRAGNDDLFGLAGSDTLLGGNGNDKIDGGTGFDVLTGGLGSDTFVFAAGHQADRITDFTDGDDVLDLTSFEFTSFSQVSALASQQGNDTVINFGNGDAIRLVDFDLADFDADDVMI